MTNAFALAGRTSSLHHTQGDALGYVLVAPSGRALNAGAYSLIQLAKREYFFHLFHVGLWAGVDADAAPLEALQPVYASVPLMHIRVQMQRGISCQKNTSRRYIQLMVTTGLRFSSAFTMSAATCSV